jgi:tripartite-type tricarboxylate transporter receptor subunit TctC
MMTWMIGRASVWLLLAVAPVLVPAQALLPGQAAAQTWPVKPVRFVIPYAPGGVADIAARVVGQKLTEAWGQQIVVENRPGGNGFIGVSTVAKAAPDGYTFLVATLGDLTINPAIFKELPYDVARDLAPVTTLTDTPCVLAVFAGAPYKTLADFIADARARPGKIAVATPGNGSVNQLIMEWMGLEAGTKFQHIPYKGGAPAAASLAGGDVPAGILAVSSVMPHVRGGRIRVLAITTARRSPLNPDWPTLQESGVAEVDGANWTALLAPKATPRPIVDKLNSEVVKILALADVKERLAVGGATTIPSSAAELDARIVRETASFKVIVQKADIHPE